MIPGFVLSNLGRIDVPESNEDPQMDRLVFLPAASELNPMVLGGIGTSGGMTFSLLFVDPPAKTGVSGTGRWSTWVFRRRYTRAQRSEKSCR